MDAQIERSTPSRADIREAILYNRMVTEKTRKDQYYRVNRLHAENYFNGLEKIRRKLWKYIDELKREGERVVYVDVCGRASAALMGADKSYTFSLQPLTNRWFLNKHDTHVCGDIFNAKDFQSFINLVRAGGARPALVTFEPIVGLQPYTPWEHPESAKKTPFHSEVTYKQLEKNLQKVVEMVRPGGYIFLGKPFQFGKFSGVFESMQRIPAGKNALSLWVKDFCKRNKCLVEIHGSHFYFIKKRDDLKKSRNRT